MIKLFLGVVVLFILNGLLYKRRRRAFNSLSDGKEHLGYRQNSNTRT